VKLADRLMELRAEAMCSPSQGISAPTLLRTIDKHRVTSESIDSPEDTAVDCIQILMALAREYEEHMVKLHMRQAPPIVITRKDHAMMIGCQLMPEGELRDLAEAAVLLGLRPNEAPTVLGLTCAPFNDDDVRALESMIEEHQGKAAQCP